MSTTLVQQLYDREAIKELKARYCRLVDDKDWDEFRQLFTHDATFILKGHEPILGADAWVAFVRRVTEGTGARTVHHVQMPEIAISGDTEARGKWVLTDYLEWPADPVTGQRRGVRGYGRYEETYRKLDGEWKIAEWRLSYQRQDPLLPQPLLEEVPWPEVVVERQRA
jgi:uncharacterized protein (TIGR02246 family)